MSAETLRLLLRKLEACGPLAAADRQAVLQLPCTLRTVAPATYLVREGEPSRGCSVLLSGFAYRHKIVGDGGRQIVSIHIPGEALDFQGLELACSDHNVQTLTRADLAVIPLAALRQLIEARPLIAAAVQRHVAVEASIFREWIANVGRRDARTRLAHLLCEFARRMDYQQLSGPSYELPMTQEQIGDALGLTSVHVNRSIRTLEAEGLVAREGRRITFPDIRKLRDIGDFSELYLHLGDQPALA